jgi:hypothetical protein
VTSPPEPASNWPGCLVSPSPRSTLNGSLAILAVLVVAGLARALQRRNRSGAVGSPVRPMRGEQAGPCPHRLAGHSEFSPTRCCPGRDLRTQPKRV